MRLLFNIPCDSLACMVPDIDRLAPSVIFESNGLRPDDFNIGNSGNQFLDSFFFAPLHAHSGIRLVESGFWLQACNGPDASDFLFAPTINKVLFNLLAGLYWEVVIDIRKTLSAPWVP